MHTFQLAFSINVIFFLLDIEDTVQETPASKHPYPVAYGVPLSDTSTCELLWIDFRK